MTHERRPGDAIAEDLVRRALTRGVPHDDLARRFDVSPPAMAWRLYNLGVVDDPPVPTA